MNYADFKPHMNTVIVQYIETALWFESCQGTATQAHADPSNCRGDDCDTSLQDLNFTINNLSSACARDMEADIEGFVTSCLGERPDIFDGISPDFIGHDFWLTRNGRGVGFWDRGLGERGEWLTKMSKPFGGSCLYVNNNGEVEVM